MRVGIELELLIPYNKYDLFLKEIHSYNWKDSYDGSIKCQSDRYKAREIKKLSNLDRFIDDMKFIYQCYKKYKIKVNNTCGFHLHISYPSASLILKLIYVFANNYIMYDEYSRFAYLVNTSIFDEKHEAYMQKRLKNYYSSFKKGLTHHATFSLSDFRTLELRFFDPHLDGTYIRALHEYLVKLDKDTRKFKFDRNIS